MDNKIYAANRGPGITRKPYGEGLIWGQEDKFGNQKIYHQT